MRSRGSIRIRAGPFTISAFSASAQTLSSGRRIVPDPPAFLPAGLNGEKSVAKVQPERVGNFGETQAAARVVVRAGELRRPRGGAFRKDVTEGGGATDEAQESFVQGNRCCRSVLNARIHIFWRQFTRDHLKEA